MKSLQRKITFLIGAGGALMLVAACDSSTMTPGPRRSPTLTTQGAIMPGDIGDACPGGMNDCMPGLTCAMDDPGGGQCQKSCSPGNDADCGDPMKYACNSAGTCYPRCNTTADCKRASQGYACVDDDPPRPGVKHCDVAPPQGNIGDPCPGGAMDCMPGLTCAMDDPGGGQCQKSCTPGKDAECGDPMMFVCSSAGTCYPRCNTRADCTRSAQGYACKDDNPPRDVKFCDVADPGMIGDPCPNGTKDCAQGLVCLTAAPGGGQCSKTCTPTIDPTCGDATMYACSSEGHCLVRCKATADCTRAAQGYVCKDDTPPRAGVMFCDAP
jgi:hypothetical protein